MATYDDSILTDVKASLGLANTITVFDTEIRMHTNSVLGTLNQLGIGPEGGFEIETVTETWADLLLTDLTLSPVKSYIFLRVKMLFDPPANSWTNTAMKEQIEQLEWRINEAREDKIPVPVTPVPDVDEEDPFYWYLDGGTL